MKNKKIYPKFLQNFVNKFSSNLDNSIRNDYPSGNYDFVTKKYVDDKINGDVATEKSRAETEEAKKANKVTATAGTGLATVNTEGIVTAVRAIAAADVPKATASAFGTVKPDDVTLEVNALGLLELNRNGLIQSEAVISGSPGTPVI